jgi:serine/threonine protein kinase
VFRNVYARNLEDAKKQFRNEVCIMRRLASSHHVIKLHATYLAGRELALILDPVASDGDLANFIQEYRDMAEELEGANDLISKVRGLQDLAQLQRGGRADKLGQLIQRKGSMRAIMQKAFGCLASGLAFIHKQTIRHKDIKPQNILIHEGNVLYTDFGFSLDHSALGRSTTTGRPDAFTRRYCAPEVAEHDKRNSKSDIFSLGCVFAEITTALYPFLNQESLIEGPFYQRIAAEGPSFAAAKMKIFPHFVSMLAWEPDDRPSAHEVCLSIIRYRAAKLDEDFCPRCLHWINSAEPRKSNSMSISQRLSA